jgi:hypothetical protein
MHLRPNEQAVFAAVDINHYYHQFIASEERAARTPVGTPLLGSLLSTLPGCEGLDPGKKYYGCFKGLGMGDHCAVDVALEAHERVLLDGLVLDDSRWVRGDRPVPGGPVLLEIIIDDLIVAVKLPRGRSLSSLSAAERLDLEIVDTARKAYDRASMPGAPEKDQVGKSVMTAAGLEVDGVAGIGGPPRDRLLPLALLTMKAAALPESTVEFVEVITGVWTSCLLARRPLMVVLHHLYAVKNEDRRCAVNLPRRAASELALLAVLAPVIASDLRAPYDLNIYATDASPHGGGITVLDKVCSEEVADELWRRRERRGGYTRLEDPSMAAARAYGIADDLAPAFGLEDWRLLADASPSLPPAQRWDFLFPSAETRAF